ncbi:MAG: M20 family metallopeptidase [Oscillospiraceae bacterium]|nr:M20 family metallopeptidase [Oscillospiraceae bacterium]
MNVLSEIELHYSENICRLASEIHKNPELSMHETLTTALITKTLQSLNIEILDIGLETGVAGLLSTGKSGPTIALRADIDAINQTEQTDREDKSRFPGIMHGCGHDTHTAGLLGAAMLLSSIRSRLAGDVVFLFQPAEEPLSGARYMIEHGLFDRVRPKALFGLHNYPEIPVGSIGVKLGQLMSFKDEFTVIIHGSGGHSSMPEKNIDPILPAAAIIQALHSVVSRNVSPLKSAVLSVCYINAGTPANLVVNEAVISGNLRTLDPEVRDRALERIRRICTDIASGYECTADLQLNVKALGVINGPDMYQLARRAATAVFGEDHIVDPPVSLASEDFSMYGRYVPSFFYFLGSGTPGKPVYSWHNARFCADSHTPVFGAALLSQSVLVAQDIDIDLSGDNPLN